MAKISRLEVIETGARRRWTPEEKLRIAEESYRGPRLVSSTARRHGLSPNQRLVWRRLYREGNLVGSEDSIAVVADSNGNPYNAYSYDAWGKTRNASAWAADPTGCAGEHIHIGPVQHIPISPTGP